MLCNAMLAQAVHGSSGRCRIIFLLVPAQCLIARTTSQDVILRAVRSAAEAIRRITFAVDLPLWRTDDVELAFSWHFRRFK